LRRYPVSLTAAGEQLAKRSKRRHDVVLQFLIAIGVNEKTAEIDAEGIEHHVSDETLTAMDNLTPISAAA